MSENLKINVLSAVCGSGKTTRLINMVSNLPMSAKVIYITPLLSECFRISGAIKDEDSDDPTFGEEGEYNYDYSHKLANRRFRHPMSGRNSIGTKISDLKYLIENNCNVVATHALYKLFTKEIIEILRSKNYILILDETLAMYEQYKGVTEKGLKSYFDNEWMYIDKDEMTLRWNHKFSYVNGRLEDIGVLCDNEQLLLIDGKAVIIEFPIECMKCFNEIWIATYMFEGSQMYYYLNYYKIDINIIRFGNKPSEYKKYINIVTDRKYNEVGRKAYSLGYSDLCERKTNIDELSTNLYNFMRYKTKSKPDDRLWTIYKPICKNVSRGNFAKSWLAFNTRATNDYIHTHNVAYLLNLYVTPLILKLFAYRGHNMNQELYALGEMIQFVFRSAIRNKEPINLYIPSLRMRVLFMDWLDDKFEIFDETFGAETQCSK